MRGKLSMLAAAAVAAALAAQTAPAKQAQATACEPPTMSDVSWSWDPSTLGYREEREISVHFTLNVHGSGGGTLYLKLNNSDPNTNDGNIGEAFNIGNDTDEIGSFNDTLMLGQTYRFSITYWNGCVGNQLKYGLMVSFVATVGKPGALYSSAPKAAPVLSKPVCSAYYVIDSRGSGESDRVLSTPGAEFVRQLRLKKGYQAVHAVTNPYPAVGVIPTLTMLKQSLARNWRGLAAEWHIVASSLNGAGAMIHSKWIGAYNDSRKEGEADLRSIIRREVAACGGGTKILLDGYSQGAQVTANVYQSLGVSIRQRIAGVVLFGDPKYNHLSWAADAYPRDNNGILSPRGFFPPDTRYKVLSFCHARDPVCQGWGQFFLHGWRAHRNYAQLGEPKLAAAYFATS